MANVKKWDFRVKGPIRLPTKQLTITTRMTPNGEGSKTWDRYEMRIHKRLIDPFAPSDMINVVTGKIEIRPSVEVEGALPFPSELHVREEM